MTRLRLSAHRTGRVHLCPECREPSGHSPASVAAAEEYAPVEQIVCQSCCAVIPLAVAARLREYAETQDE